MAQFFYDFSTYADGDIATVSSGAWATQGTLTSWTRQVVTDGAATGGKALVVQDTSLDWGDQFSAILNATVGATTGDIEVVARWKLTTFANLNGTPVIGPVLMSAANASYGARIVTATSVRGTEFAGATANDNIGAAFTVTTVPSGSYVWTRVGRSGSTIRVKFWNDGETEPASWQGSATNTVIGSVRAGVAFYDYNAGPYTVDVVGIGTAGDAAPTTDAENVPLAVDSGSIAAEGSSVNLLAEEAYVLPVTHRPCAVEGQSLFFIVTNPAEDKSIALAGQEIALLTVESFNLDVESADLSAEGSDVTISAELFISVDHATAVTRGYHIGLINSGLLPVNDNSVVRNVRRVGRRGWSHFGRH